MPWSRIAVVLGLWAMLVAVVALGVRPSHPGSARGFVLLAIAAPPAYVALELVAQKLLCRRAGLRLAPERLSWTRIHAVLLAFVAVAALLAAALRF